MSRIRQTLTLQTSLGPMPLNFTLQATVPASALSLCAATLPRPVWEPLLYYAAVLSVGFLLFGVIVASYFEADRISVADIIRRNAELSHAGTMFEKGRMFNLRSISRNSLSQSHSVCDGDVTVKNGSPTLAFGQLAVNASQKSQFDLETTTNGHVLLPNMLSSGDGQRSCRSILRYFERLWSHRSRTPSVSKSSPCMVTNETEVWAVDYKSGSGNRSASRGSRRWNLLWLGFVALRTVLQKLSWLAAKLTCPFSAHSTPMSEDIPPDSGWPDNRQSLASSCESSPCQDVDSDYLTAVAKPDTKALRRYKSANDHVSYLGSSEPQSKTGYCCLFKCTHKLSICLAVHFCTVLGFSISSILKKEQVTA